MTNVIQDTTLPVVKNIDPAIDNAAKNIYNYSKKNYIDMSAICLQKSNIEIRVVEHDNPYYTDIFQTQRLAEKICDLTGLVISSQFGDGTIVLNEKRETGEQK